MKPKFTYQSYDYSFLEKREGRFFTTAKRVFAKTIGFDLAEVQPMDEPVGQLYWMDYPFETTVTTDDTTYEPMHTGGWEVRFTPPVTVTETPVTTTTGVYTQESETEPVINNTWWQRGPHRPPKYIRSTTELAKVYTTNRTLRRKQSSAEYFRKRNYFKKLSTKIHGKKI